MVADICRCSSGQLIPIFQTRLKTAKTNISLLFSYMIPIDCIITIYTCSGTHLGSANRKIDIFKITCKVLLCVEAGLIKKKLSWNQILCIPYSANLKLLYQTSCISARWSMSFADRNIWHTDTWLRGEHSGKCCSMSCNSVVLQVTNC